jgi:hypothetical protein
MKIYVASSFSLIEKVENVVEALEYHGHVITCKWWARNYEIEGEGPVNTQELKKRFNDLTPETFYGKPETERSYFADLDGIEEADALVLVGPDDASRSALLGANIELGYALGYGLACFSIGALVNSAMYFGLIRCELIGELCAVLKDVEDEL